MLFLVTPAYDGLFVFLIQKDHNFLFSLVILLWVPFLINISPECELYT